MASFLKVILKNLMSGPSTDPFPFGETFSPERIRGRVRIDPKLCFGCSMCRYSCVAGAINIQRHENEGWTITVWQDSCCLCGSCRTYCPTGAVTIEPDWHSAHTEEDKFRRVEQHTIIPTPCRQCGKPMRVFPIEKARELYAFNKDVNAEEIQLLCPECRRALDAKHNVCLLPPKAPKEAAPAKPAAIAKEEAPAKPVAIAKEEAPAKPKE